ncbi:polysulfide reductase, NrfD [Peptococcaceae bacterium CEB3]|nr:polysulfide reductase, NrfD [Peptococcaceae bacterium CEB3]
MHTEVTWGLLIVVYLFTAGVSAGAMVASNAAFLLGGDRYERVARWGAYLAPFPIAFGTGVLLLDLGSPLNFYHLFMTLQYKSPMSWGSWAILLFTLLSLLYLYLWLPPRYQVGHVIKRVRAWKGGLAKGMPILAVSVASYTGVLLNAADRPLWQIALLPELFLVSAMSTGVAAVGVAVALSRRWRASHEEKLSLALVDIVLVGIELLIFGAMMIDSQIGTLNQQLAYAVLWTGSYAAAFWIMIMILGLVVPLILKIVEVRGRLPWKWNEWVGLGSSLLVLVGGFFVRYVITYAGQMTGWLR